MRRRLLAQPWGPALSLSSQATHPHAQHPRPFALLFKRARWDEDVVFKNTTRGEVKAPRRFINDTVRNDYHKRFIDRYIK